MIIKNLIELVSLIKINNKNIGILDLGNGMVHKNLLKKLNLDLRDITIISNLNDIKVDNYDYLNYILILEKYNEKVKKIFDIYLEKGGQLILYLENFKIISKKPKLLVTGCDGFIGSYIKEKYIDFNLYGITRKKFIEKNILKYFFDLKNTDKLKECINIINPDIIIHLAGISSTIDAYNNPLKCININGNICVNICQIILEINKNIKFINLCSSEMYKGRINFNLDEYKNIDNTNHIHPYSIAKSFSMKMTKFYRNNYNLNFSNVILFTCQSYRKSEKFLLNKIFQHLKKYRDSKVLFLNSLNSYRNIIHPYDVIEGLKYIISNPGDDYSLCNYNSFLIIDLVKRIYSLFNIELIRGNEPNIYYDSKSNNPLIIINDYDNGLDDKSINITGYPCKLRYLGWKINYTIDDIIDEFKKNI